MPETNWIRQFPQWIKLYDHEKTQSVNICTMANEEGLYEEVFYFCERFRVSREDLSRYGNLQTLRQDLRERAYRQVVELWKLSQGH